MKALLILLLIYINYVLSDEANYKVKIYPKKVKPGNVQLINTGKYKKSPLRKYARKQTNADNKFYTVFPLEVDERIAGNVSSPYAAPENGTVGSRVKKVLPDYVWYLRRKRSAVPDDPKTKPAENKVQAETPKLEAEKVKANITAATTTKAKPKEKAASHKAKKNRKPKPPQHKAGGKNTSKPKPKAGKPVKAKRPAKRGSNKKPARSKAGAKPKARKPGRAGKAAKGKGQNKKKGSRRLIAAREAKIEDYPYVVSIHKGNHYWCAGALLNPRLVITTANCMWKANRIGRLRIRVGSRHIDHGGQLAGVAEVLKHPAWSVRSQPDNDIALIVLDRSIKFSDSVHGVDIPNHAMLPAFDDAWVTSWGSDRRDGVYDSQPSSLQVYHTRLMDWGKCNNVTQRYGVSVTSNFICLAQTGKQAPCTRDTGAPAVSDGILWGLASWGIRKLCGTERFPAMFSYLASPDNLNFIVNATHYLMADQRQYPFLDRFPVISPRASSKAATRNHH